MWTKHQHQHGQSLVLVALGAIVLIAFVGLAVDGGMAFAQRRVAQNAADGASVKGAYLMAGFPWRYDTIDPAVRRDMLLREVNEMAELHGVPDTNGNANDAVNGNVHAFYRDENGNTIASCADVCEVATTLDIPETAWGVEVTVALPFTTYFSGIIGWSEITVATRALAVVHAGERGAEGERWAVFATDSKSCDGDSGYEIDISGTNNDLNGNAHSNHSLRMGVFPNEQLADYAEMTYVPTGAPAGICVNCIREKIRPRIGLVLPDFDEYYDLAYTEAPVSQRYEGLPTPPGYPRPTLVFGNSATVLGSDGSGSLAPYTFIDGDLVITRTGTTIINLAGLIVVNGNVDIQAPKVRGKPYGFTLIATGSIRVSPTNTLLDGKAYEYPGASWDPMVQTDGNDAILWSNQDLDDVGGNACTTPVIEFLGYGVNVRGAVMAPTGRVDFPNTLAQKLINGAVIADTIQVTGANNELKYNARYFPPQPDLIELME